MTETRDPRPQNCRFRLQEEGKGYPRSGCHGCGRNITNGLGKECHIGRPTPPQGGEDER